MPKLVTIELRNFRSCEKTELTLADFTPLVGRNNAGKTNILRGIAWLLRGTLLTEADFRDKDKPVVVTGLVDGIDEATLTSLGPNHSKQVKPYVSSTGTIRIRREQPGPNAAKKDVRFLVIDPNATTDEDEDAAWRVNPAGIDQAIQNLFPAPILVGAMEDVPTDIAKNKTATTLGKLIRAITESLWAKHATEVHEALAKVRSQLSADGDDRSSILTDFDNEATRRLEDLYPGLSIRVHIPPPELDSILAGGTVRVSEDNRTWRAIEDMGHGAQRSIQMALIRQLSETTPNTRKTSTRTLLLVDEPELYQHPQAVELIRSSLEALPRKGYQVVFATHSPLMIRREDAQHTVIIRKDNGSTIAERTVREAVEEKVKDRQAQAKLLFKLENASELLFSDHVLFVEGNTERTLLPEIFCAVRGCTLAKKRLGLVDVGGADSLLGAIEVAQVMKINAKAVADLDYAFKTAVKVGIIPEDDKDYTAAREWFRARKNSDDKMELGNDGFPKNGRQMTAADAFAEFARSAQGATIAGRMHDVLLERDIWLWRKGCLEHYFDDLDGKNEDSLLGLARSIRDKGKVALGSAIEEMEKFINWLDPED